MPEAVLYTKMGVKGGKSGKGPKKDKQKYYRKHKNPQKYNPLQMRGHIMNMCMSKLQGNPPNTGNSVIQALTKTNSTLTTSIENE